MRSAQGNRGFTLIEMMVVMSIILILLAIAVPLYSQSMNHARETNLRQNLETLNKVISQYTLDKKKAPQSLGDLVSSRYIEFIPEDITGRSDTWAMEPEDPQKAWDPNQPGIGFVHSGSNETSSEGTPYSSWMK